MKRKTVEDLDGIRKGKAKFVRLVVPMCFYYTMRVPITFLSISFDIKQEDSQ